MTMTHATEASGITQSPATVFFPIAASTAYPSRTIADKMKEIDSSHFILPNVKAERREGMARRLRKQPT